jgi:hypothetical protein
MGRQKCSEKNIFEWHIVYHKSNTDYLEIEVQPAQYNSETNSVGLDALNAIYKHRNAE